jgi:hypothetical protein
MLFRMKRLYVRFFLVKGRMGDDLGFKSSTLFNPNTIREFILPKYKRVIDLVHSRITKSFCCTVAGAYLM